MLLFTAINRAIELLSLDRVVRSHRANTHSVHLEAKAYYSNGLELTNEDLELIGERV